jgi:hydrogenase maturation protease
MQTRNTVLVLGLGNTLLSDDGIGVHVVEALRAGEVAASGDVVLRDGGTLGLALLPEIEDVDALIVVDAAAFAGAPGEVRVFEGAAMDAQLAGKRHTVHEVNLVDLMGAAELSGVRPERRALVGIEPQSFTWGLEPTPVVAAAVPHACVAVQGLIAGWRA